MKEYGFFYSFFFFIFQFELIRILLYLFDNETTAY